MKNINFVNRIRTFYIWILSKINRKMSLSLTHNTLQRSINKLFNDIEFHLKSIDDNPHPDYLKFINKTEQNLEYNFGNFNFIIKAEINALQSTVLYKTYLIIDDDDNHPNKKLQHLPTEDIEEILQGMKFFVKSKHTEALINLPLQYFSWIISYLKNKR